MRKVLTLTITIIVLLAVFLFAGCEESVPQERNFSIAQDYATPSNIQVTPISVTNSLGPVTFGKYPQTKSGDVTITSGKLSNGYYLGSDNNYYALLRGAYFKVEDVVWDSYQLDNGDILLISQNILFAARFDDYQDYFEKEREIFDEEGFVFTDEENAKIQTSGIEYSYRMQSSTKFLKRMFLLNVEQVTNIYTSASSVLKTPTDYCKRNLTLSDYGYSDWWIAPEKGRSYYISKQGTISNKDNTYIEVTENYARARYAWRGVAPAMIISNN